MTHHVRGICRLTPLVVSALKSHFYSVATYTFINNSCFEYCHSTFRMPGLLIDVRSVEKRREALQRPTNACVCREWRDSIAWWMLTWKCSLYINQRVLSFAHQPPLISSHFAYIFVFPLASGRCVHQLCLRTIDLCSIHDSQPSNDEVSQPIQPSRSASVISWDPIKRSFIRLALSDAVHDKSLRNRW